MRQPLEPPQEWLTGHRPPKTERERERENPNWQRTELMEGPTCAGLLEELAKVIKKPGHRSRKHVRESRATEAQGWRRRGECKLKRRE